MGLIDCFQMPFGHLEPRVSLLPLCRYSLFPFHVSGWYLCLLRLSSKTHFHRNTERHPQRCPRPPDTVSSQILMRCLLLMLLLGIWAPFFAMLAAAGGVGAQGDGSVYIPLETDGEGSCIHLFAMNRDSTTIETCRQNFEDHNERFSIAVLRVLYGSDAGGFCLANTRRSFDPDCPTQHVGMLLLGCLPEGLFPFWDSHVAVRNLLSMKTSQ